jgi:hypothetical protein
MSPAVDMGFLMAKNYFSGFTFQSLIDINRVASMKDTTPSPTHATWSQPTCFRHFRGWERYDSVRYNRFIVVFFWRGVNFYETRQEYSSAQVHCSVPLKLFPISHTQKHPRGLEGNNQTYLGCPSHRTGTKVGVPLLIAAILYDKKALKGSTK